MTRIRAEAPWAGGGGDGREMYLILLSFCMLKVFHLKKQLLLHSVVICLISAFLSAAHLKRWTVFLVIIVIVTNMQQPCHNASSVGLLAAGRN